MNEQEMVVVATKVSKESKAIIDSICAKMDITIYDLIQMCLDALIRYTCPQFNLTEELNTLIRLFDGLKDWDRSITLTDPKERMQIVGAYYVLAQAGRKGNRIMYTDGSVCGHAEYTYNVQEMFEHLVSVLLPVDTYKAIRRLGVDLETSSAFETITKIVNEYDHNPDIDELRKLFEDNDWVGNKHQHDEGERAKRTMVNSMEAFERRQTSLQFDI